MKTEYTQPSRQYKYNVRLGLVVALFISSGIFQSDMLVARCESSALEGAKELTAEAVDFGLARHYLEKFMYSDRDDYCSGFFYDKPKSFELVSFTSGYIDNSNFTRWEPHSTERWSTTYYFSDVIAYRFDGDKAPDSRRLLLGAKMWRKLRDREAKKFFDFLSRKRVFGLDGSNDVRYVTHAHVLSSNYHITIPVKVNENSTFYHVVFRGGPKGEVEVVMRQYDGLQLFYKRVSQSSFGEHQLTIPIPEKTGTYAIVVYVAGEETLQYDFVHGDTVLEEEAAEEETLVANESPSTLGLSERILSAIANSQNSIETSAANFSVYRDKSGKEYFEGKIVSEAIAEARISLLGPLATSQATALRDFIDAEILLILDKLDIYKLSTAALSLAFYDGLGRTAIYSLRTPPVSSSEIRLAKDHSGDYVTKSSTVEALRLFSELLQILEGVAEEPIINLCVRTYPSGADFYLRPVSAPVGAHRLSTTVLFGGVARGIYQYEIIKSGYKTVSFKDLNLVRTGGDTLECALFKVSSTEEPIPCQIIRSEGPCGQ